MIDYNLKQEEKRHKKRLLEFTQNNPIAAEDFFIDYRIGVVERVLSEYKKSANFKKGFELDGKEVIDGVLTTTKMGTATDCIMLYNELKYLKYRLNELNEPKTVQLEAAQPEKVKSDRDEEQNWFKVGLLFATGEIYSLLAKHQNNATHLAKELRNEKGFRPFISDSIGDNADRPTNIFSRPKKIRTLHRYCIEKKIDMCDEFLNKYSQIESD